MPVYIYHCNHCHNDQEVYKQIADIDRIEVCLKCHRPMERVLSVPSGSNFQPYYSDNLSPHDDRPILVESPAHRRKLEKEANVIPRGAGIGKPGCWV